MESEVDLDSLTGWMTEQGLGSGAITSARLLAGGTQNIIVRFERGGRDYVLRRPPLHLRANSNDTMRREARVLGALAGTDVPHPGLIATCADETVLGAAFYLMEPVEGFTAIGTLPEPHASSAAMRCEMGLALVDGIAALGRVDYRAVGLEGFGRPEGFLERQVPRWGGQLASYAGTPEWTGLSALPAVDRIAAWLESHRPADCIPGIMHGDFHLANVMFRHDGPQLAAIIDWELATIGDPLLDLGWLLATWPDGDPENPLTMIPCDGFPGPEALIARYAAGSVRDTSAIEWYLGLACYKLGIILEGTHVRACAGQAPRETGDKLHARAVLLLERAEALTR